MANDPPSRACPLLGAHFSTSPQDSTLSCREFFSSFFFYFNPPSSDQVLVGVYLFLHIMRGHNTCVCDSSDRKRSGSSVGE